MAIATVYNQPSHSQRPHRKYSDVWIQGRITNTEYVGSRLIEHQKVAVSGYGATNRLLIKTLDLPPPYFGGRVSCRVVEDVLSQVVTSSYLQ